MSPADIAARLGPQPRTMPQEVHASTVRDGAGALLCHVTCALCWHGTTIAHPVVAADGQRHDVCGACIGDAWS